MALVATKRCAFRAPEVRRLLRATLVGSRLILPGVNPWTPAMLGAGASCIGARGCRHAPEAYRDAA